MTKTENTYNILEENYKSKDSIYNGIYNKTTLFMLPAIDFNIRYAPLRKHLVNVYLNDFEYYHDYQCPLFVLLKTKTFEESSYKDLIKSFKDSKFFVCDYSVGTNEDHNLVMYVFEVPKQFHDVYYNFKGAKYSKFSKEYRNKFPKLTVDNTNKSVESLMWGVINKSTYRKEQVAKHFSIQNAEGKIIDMDAYNELLSDMENWDEIWDKIYPKEEVYRYKTI